MTGKAPPPGLTPSAGQARPRSRLRIARRALAILVGLVVLLALLGYLLPSRVPLVETEATLEASAAQLFAIFNSRAGQQRLWTQAWRRSGGGSFPPMKIVDLGGPAAGAGARMGFFPAGQELGSFGGIVSSLVRGRGILVESEPDRRVVLEIDFGMLVAHRVIELEVLSEGNTRVRWSETLQIDNPLMRYLAWFLDPAIAEGFDEVLAAAEEVANMEAEEARSALSE